MQMKPVVQENLRPGVSGMMRVKNDGQFIEACVESCIDALDELIIVWNDCTDNSAEVIERMRQRYPEKIKTYEYKYKVYSTNLTKEEYEYAKSLPEDSPHLLCNYYNFCLSKVTYQYAVKIDADQIYFTEKMNTWCDFLRFKKHKSLNVFVIIGFIIAYYYKILKKINELTKSVWHLSPSIMPYWIKKSYLSYSRFMASNYDYAIVLSGLNIVKFGNNWYVPLGQKNDKINILPPFNGAGDHLFFKVNKDCYFETLDDPFYSRLLSNRFTLIEVFHCPYKLCYGGYFWHHLNMMRPNVYDKLLSLFTSEHDRFIHIEELKNLSYKELDRIIDKEMYNIDTRSFSQFVYPYDVQNLMRNAVKG